MEMASITQNRLELKETLETLSPERKSTCINHLTINRYGKNYKRPPKIRSLFELILENFEDRILQILLIAATVALIVGVVQHGWETGWVEGMSIYIAVCIIVTVTAGNNYIKEKQF